MKCHILFSEKNKKNISKCRLLKILPRVLSVKVSHRSRSWSQVKFFCMSGKPLSQGTYMPNMKAL